MARKRMAWKDVAWKGMTLKSVRNAAATNMRVGVQVATKAPIDMPDAPTPAVPAAAVPCCSQAVAVPSSKAAVPSSEAAVPAAAMPSSRAAAVPAAAMPATPSRAGASGRVAQAQHQEDAQEKYAGTKTVAWR